MLIHVDDTYLSIENVFMFTHYGECFTNWLRINGKKKFMQIFFIFIFFFPKTKVNINLYFNSIT